MNNTKTTKRALLSSVMAMLICVAMLIGTTFAWFTDSASTAVNKIQAGTLEIQLLDESGNSLEGETLSWQKAAGHESEAVLWEPGCKYELQPITIKNNGNLALKYKIVITGIKGSAKLNDAIDWEIKTDDTVFDFDTYHSLAAKGNANDSDKLTISGKMKPDAGNEYQGLSIDGIGITVVATQDTVEFDSTTDQYDINANEASVWDGNTDPAGLAANTNDVTKTVAIKTANQFAAFAEAVNGGNSYAGYTINLMAPIDLNNIEWTPIGQNTIAAYPGYTFSGTFNGNGLTISNLKVSATGEHGTAALFGSANNAVIKNVVIDGANVSSKHYAAAILGYETKSTQIYGCTVKNATIKSSVENSSSSWDNGDKVGGIVGYMEIANIKGCIVENTTISAYRDVGGIVGCSNQGNITDCSIDSVTITVDTASEHNYKNYTSNDQHNANDILGRNSSTTLTNCKGTATINY